MVVGGANGVVQLWEVDSSLNVTLKSAIELLGAVTGLSFDKELHIVCSNYMSIKHSGI